MGPLKACLGGAKVVILLSTSSKNRFLKKRGSKSRSRSQFDGLNIAIALQESLQRGPQIAPKSMVCAKNTVNNEVFGKFHYFAFFTSTSILSKSKFEYATLKACVGSGFRQVLRSNEPPKVVISLMTSLKNQVFKQGASKTSPKPLLRSF